LNPHASRRHPLKMVCLPISPLPHFGTASFSIVYLDDPSAGFPGVFIFSPLLFASASYLQASDAQESPDEQKLLNRVCLRVDVTHRRFDVIVTGDVLQRKEVGVLAGLSQERVPQPVKSGVWVRLDLLAQGADLGFEDPGAKRSRWVSRMSKDLLTPRNGKEPFQHLFHLCVDL
jgi:hypothetical protein